MWDNMYLCWKRGRASAVVVSLSTGPNPTTWTSEGRGLANGAVRLRTRRLMHGTHQTPGRTAQILTMKPTQDSRSGIGTIGLLEGQVRVQTKHGVADWRPPFSLLDKDPAAGVQSRWGALRRTARGSCQGGRRLCPR